MARRKRARLLGALQNLYRRTRINPPTNIEKNDQSYKIIQRGQRTDVVKYSFQNRSVILKVYGLSKEWEIF